MKKIILLLVALFTGALGLVSCGGDGDSGYTKFYFYYDGIQNEIEMVMWEAESVPPAVEGEPAGQLYDIRVFNQKALDKNTYSIRLSLPADRFGKLLDVTDGNPKWNLEFNDISTEREYARLSGGALTGDVKSGTVRVTRAGSSFDISINVVFGDDRPLKLYYSGIPQVKPEEVPW